MGREAVLYYDPIPVMGHDWRPDAACWDSFDGMFFPERGDSVTPARRVCIGCPVQYECIAYATEMRLQAGVWGGSTYRQRAAIRVGRDTIQGLIDRLNRDRRYDR